MLPLVSVIMPAYNAEEYIGHAIESILNQTYERLELVIVEDCSTDRTKKIICSYTDSRIKLLHHEVNRGIAYSTNQGIHISQGKYIALMDDDDIAAKERLKLQVEYLEEHEEIDILGGRSVEIDDKGNVLRRGDIPRYNPKYIKAVLLFKCMNFRNGTAMIRRKFIDENHLQYQENCYGMQDYKFYIDSSKIGNISTVEDILLYYRVHGNSETMRRRKENGEERKCRYAEFQRESLKASGYNLDEGQLAIINKALAEYDGGCENEQELHLLYEAFCEILRQGRMMHIDYYAELEHYCRMTLSNQVKRLISFE